MGLFDFLRPRPSGPVHRTWTHAKDVGVFAGPGTGSALERGLAREGIQARIFVGAEGRAIEILTRFLPSVVLIRADEVEAQAILDRLETVPGLSEVPVLLAAEAVDEGALRRLLGARVGGVASSTDPAELVRAAVTLAPELLD